MLYRFCAVVLVVLYFCSCQHQAKSTIGYDQLMLYTLQKESSAQWSSKARNAAFGGMPSGNPSTLALPLFGHPFHEAKKLVRILDIRSAAKFKEKNLSMVEGSLTLILNVPLQELLNKNDLRQFLSARDIPVNSILLLVAESAKDAIKASNFLKNLGFNQVLYYENAY